MLEPLAVTDRPTIEGAVALLSDFGLAAAAEAAARAEQSRDVGNFVQFCRWRQIERCIHMLAIDEAPGAVH